MQTGKHYNYFRDYDPAIGRYIESDPIGLKGGINTYGYVKGQPLILVDPRGLASVGQSLCVLDAFEQNYKDMRNANVKGGDKFFHCKANCQAAQCGREGEKLACQISDFREWTDSFGPNHSPSDSAQDQKANAYGRGWGGISKLPCDFLCEPYRPRGLGNGPWPPNTPPSPPIGAP